MNKLAMVVITLPYQTIFCFFFIYLFVDVLIKSISFFFHHKKIFLSKQRRRKESWSALIILCVVVTRFGKEIYDDSYKKVRKKYFIIFLRQENSLWLTHLNKSGFSIKNAK